MNSLTKILALLVLSLTVQVASAAEPILVAFTASWCPPCRTMKPVLRNLKAAGADVRIVDCSKPNAWATVYRVTALPTFVVMRDNREVWRITGIVSEQQLRSMLGSVVVVVPAEPQL